MFENFCILLFIIIHFGGASQLAKSEYYKSHENLWRKDAAIKICQNLFDSADFKSVKLMGPMCSGNEIMHQWFCYTKCMQQSPVTEYGGKLIRVMCTGRDGIDPDRVELQCKCTYDETPSSKSIKKKHLEDSLSLCKKSKPSRRSRFMIDSKHGRRIRFYKGTTMNRDGYSRKAYEHLHYNINRGVMHRRRHRVKTIYTHWHRRPDFENKCKASAMRSYNAHLAPIVRSYSLRTAADAWQSECLNSTAIVSTTTLQPKKFKLSLGKRTKIFRDCEENEVYQDSMGAPECDKYCGTKGVAESCAAKELEGGCLCAKSYRRERYGGVCVRTEKCPKFELKCTPMKKNMFHCSWPPITGAENYAFIINDLFYGNRIYLLPCSQRELIFDVGDTLDNYTIILKCLKKNLYTQSNLQVDRSNDGDTYSYKLMNPKVRRMDMPGMDAFINNIVSFYQWSVIAMVKTANGSLQSDNVNSPKIFNLSMTVEDVVNGPQKYKPDGEVLENAAVLTFNTATFIKESNLCPYSDDIERNSKERSCNGGKKCVYNLEKETQSASCQ